jgi:polar amino acid transport system substrate-binding protein
MGQSPVRVEAQALPDLGRYRQDNTLITLTYPDGSLGTLAYLANGDKTVAKERVEVFCGGTVAVLDDFRRLEITANGKRQVSGSPLGQDKGHQAAWANFLACVRRGGPPPIPYEQLIAVTRASFEAVEKLACA